MLIKPRDLAGHLQKQLLPVYLVCGDEHLLCQEAADAILAAARHAGHSERHLYNARDGRQMPWGKLLTEGRSLSLLAEKGIMDVRLASSKIGRDGGAALAAWCDNPPQHNLLLVRCGKLDRSTKNSKWHKAICNTGGAVEVWPVRPHQMPSWIGARLQQAGLRASRQAVELLAERVEGNLLAAAQEVEKLRLLHRDHERSLEAEDIATLVTDSARYNVFVLHERALAGDAVGVARTIGGLRREGNQPMGLMMYIYRQLQALLQMRRQMDADCISASGAMEQARVWQSRKAITGRALERLAQPALQTLIYQCRVLDSAIKGQRRLDPWLLLEDICLSLAGTPPLNDTSRHRTLSL